MALKAPDSPLDTAHHRRLVAHVANGCLDGRTNNGGTLTLTASQTTTVVADKRASTDAVIVLCPLTANAAAALATTYVSSRGKQTFTLTHASNAQVDKTFDYALLACGRT